MLGRQRQGAGKSALRYSFHQRLRGPGAHLWHPGFRRIRAVLGRQRARPIEPSLARKHKVQATPLQGKKLGESAWPLQIEVVAMSPGNDETMAPVEPSGSVHPECVKPDGDIELPCLIEHSKQQL